MISIFTQPLLIDVNSLRPVFIDHIQSVNDSGVRELPVRLVSNGRIVSLESGFTATAMITVDDVLVTDSLACTVDAAENIITVPIDNEAFESAAGVMAVQVTVTDGTDILTIPRPVYIRVEKTIAETAEIVDGSLGSFAQVVQEIAAARGEYTTLAQAISAGLDEKITGKKTTLVGASTEDCPHVDEATDKKAVYRVYTTNGVGDGWLIFCGDMALAAGRSVRQVHFPRTAAPRIRVGTITANGGVKTVSWNEWEPLALLENALSGARFSAPDVTYNVQTDEVTAFLNSAAYPSNDYTATNIPNPVPSSWTDAPNGVSLAVPSGALKIALRDTAAGPEWKESVSGASHTVGNLAPGRVYLYDFLDSSGYALQSGTIKPSGQLRMINAGGDTFNIRDLGGWSCDGGKLKYGMIYRGAELNANVTLTAAQIQYFKDALGVRSEIDFRQSSEVNGAADTALGIGVDYARLPLNTNAYQNIYMGDIENTLSIIRLIAKNIRENKPTYLHCTRGADRTACICMFIEALCGVSQSDIDKDYELTTFTVNHFADDTSKYNSLIKTRSSGSAGAACWKNFIAHFSAKTGYTFREKIVRYLLEKGITIDEINAIRFGLIDGSPAKLASPYSDFTVTKTLTNVALENNADTVRAYQPYVTRLTAKDGYALSSVTVTMGGTNVTSSCYDGYGNIRIPRTEGNITVTASAAQIQTG